MEQAWRRQDGTEGVLGDLILGRFKVRKKRKREKGSKIDSHTQKANASSISKYMR